MKNAREKIIRTVLGMIKNRKKIKFPSDSKLSIQPTVGETQFEAYQSIIAKIMSADMNQPVDPDDMSPYEILCDQNEIRLSTKTCNNCIFFEGFETTHYVVIKNDKILDPYKYYQAGYTHGFCQMYAFFLYINEKKRFMKLSKPLSPYDMNFWRLIESNYDDFEKMVINNYVCLQKIILILETNNEVRIRFEEEFEELTRNNKLRKEYGIKPETTFDKFIKDLKSLKIDTIVYYVYDLFKEQWTED